MLASGVLNVYPPENRRLSDAIAAAGCVASEAGPTMPPFSGMFPQRNRIISGLSLGTIVVEAAARSGALITARHACEQGREVFAVPGPVNSRMSVGPHQLLRDGAKLVSTIDDVLEELGPAVDQAYAGSRGDDGVAIEVQLNEREQQILQQIEPAGSSVEAVARACATPIERVLATISVLESRRLVRKISASRTDDPPPEEWHFNQPSVLKLNAHPSRSGTIWQAACLQKIQDWQVKKTRRPHEPTPAQLRKPLTAATLSGFIDSEAVAGRGQAARGLQHRTSP